MKKENVIHLLIWTFAIIAGLLNSSCDVIKAANKSKSDTGFTESIDNRTYRKGDTVHYEIPVVHYKDTTIRRTNRQGTTIQTVYDNKGNISSIDCFASAIEEIRKENRDFRESLKEKDSKKEKVVNTEIYLYAIIGIVFIFICIIAAIFIYFSKQTSNITNTLNNLTK